MFKREFHFDGLNLSPTKKISRKSATSQLGIPPCANRHNDEVNADLSTKHAELRITTDGYITSTKEELSPFRKGHLISLFRSHLIKTILLPPMLVEKEEESLYIDPD